MKTRSAKYVSFNLDANFFYIYEDKKLVGAYVTGKSLPKNGEVTFEEFNELLEMIQRKEGINYKVNASYICRETCYIAESNRVEAKEINGLYKVCKTVNDKVRKGDYRMTRSEYSYNYFG